MRTKQRKMRAEKIIPLEIRSGENNAEKPLVVIVYKLCFFFKKKLLRIIIDL